MFVLSPENNCVLVLVLPSQKKPKHTIPTGFSGVPPVGPATPVIDTATSL